LARSACAGVGAVERDDAKPVGEARFEVIGFSVLEELELVGDGALRIGKRGARRDALPSMCAPAAGDDSYQRRM
jgi:hypothetical protein